MPPFLGRLESPPDVRDHPLRSIMPLALLAAATERLPWRYVDRSTKRYRVRADQHENSCVGRSGAFAKVIQERKDHRRTLAFDALWLWSQAKMRDGFPNPNADRGTTIRAALEVLLGEGLPIAGGPLEVTQPYRIAEYVRLASITEMKVAIRHFGPIILGQSWYRSWFTPGPGGMLPEPDTDQGGHATAGIGWDDRIRCPDGSRGAIRAANSWSEAWGDQGDYWLPYVYIGPGRPADEAWKAVDAATGIR